jgi:hypothetical protein
MRLPQTPGLNRFAQRCITTKTDVLTVDRNEAQQLAKELTQLLQYCTSLQDQVIEAQQANIGTIEIVAPGFDKE